MRRALLVIALVWSVPAGAGSLEKTGQEISDHLDAWDVAAAGRLLGELATMYPEDPDVRFLQGRHAFLRSRYGEAVAHLEAAARLRRDDKGLQYHLELARSTLATVKDFKEVLTSRGHFILAFSPGVDEVLVPYADQALEKAYDELGTLFRYRPSEPVRVEIYAKVSNLADVSPLRVSEIETSGTIALCKYNRLMIVSPRALIHGYSWLDTLAHEYIHLLVTRRSRNRVPIWLHEGLAKFFENRWRESTNARLSPPSEDLLARAVKEKRLIRFAAMSPSMAKLPSQEDTALAFAEVFMVIEWLYAKGGVESVNRLLDGMRNGRTDREAVEIVTGRSFARFQQDWRGYLAQRNLKPLPTHARARLLFRNRDKPKDELKDIPEERARNLTFIGDQLAVRRRFLAAAKEYAKAITLAGGPNPIISAKLAAALLKRGRHRRVVEVVTPALKLNPEHGLLYLYRGKARLAIGDYEQAREDLGRTVQLNPFDPEVHDFLARAYAKLGSPELAERERRQQRLLMR